MNLVLALRLRRRVAGQWLGGVPRQSGKRALATRLGVLAAALYVGGYVTTWAAGPEPATWVTVLTGLLLGSSIVLMATTGVIFLLGLQDDATAEWERDHGGSRSHS